MVLSELRKQNDWTFCNV